MADYDVKFPDGRTVTVQAPDNASEAQVYYLAQQRVGDIEAPSPAVRIGRGAMDVGQGLKQLYYMASDAVTGRNEADAYRQKVNEELRLYDRGRGPDAGFDAWRMAGAAAAMAPAGMVAAPAMAGATTLGRAAIASGLGAAQGAAEYSPSGTWTDKAIQTGLGAATGGVAQVGIDKVIAPVAGKIAELAKQGVQALWSRVPGALDRQAIQTAVAQQVNDAGLNWNALSAGQQGSIIDDAIAAARSGKTLNAPAAARAADFKALNMEGTQGQVTREPGLWTAEQEAAKLDRVGVPLKERFVTQNQQLLDAAGQLRTGIGGMAGTGYEAGEAARTGVGKFASDTRGAVNALYDTARKAAGADAEVPLQPIADTLGKVADQYGLEHIAGPVSSRLAMYGLVQGGNQTKSLTVAEAQQLRTFLGNNINPSNRPQMAALKQLQGAVDEAVANVAAAGGDQGAAQAFQTARAAFANRARQLEPTPVARLADAAEAPVNFIQTHVLGAKPRELAGLQSVLMQSAPEAWANIRSQVVQHLIDKATLGDPAGLFSGARFRKALDQIGNDRLSVLFSPQEVAQLGTISRVAQAVTVAPPLSSVNYSNTASTLHNLMLSQNAGPGLVGRALGTLLPGLGPMAVGAADAGKRALAQGALRREVAAAANPSAASMATPPSGQNVQQALAQLLTNGGLYWSPVPAVEQYRQRVTAP